MKKVIENYKDALALRDELSAEQMKGFHLLYRGHEIDTYELLSMVGRKKPKGIDLLQCERECFNEFVDTVIRYKWEQFKLDSYNNKMFYLSLGRHLGLDCRLLDWTASLDTALYFASYKKQLQKEKGALWIMLYRGSLEESSAKFNPFDVKEVTLVKEAYIIPRNQKFDNLPLGELRRFYQNGFFTITPSDKLTIPLNSIQTNHIEYIKIEVTPNAKIDIMDNLGSDYTTKVHMTSKESMLESTIKRINEKHFNQ